MQYYSTNEISKMLGLKIKTIQKLIRDKKIIAFRVGKRFRVADTDLKQFIESQRI
ncbi:MAG: helix-turn-helix domain-containing protein [Bacilli bacterium]